MQKVTIISTEHVESGKCNSEELLKILESIKPEVIFEEEPNDDHYHSCYSDQNSFKSLEIQTIIKYKQNHNIANIPIDKPINEFASIYLLDCFTKIFQRFQDHKNIVRKHCYLRDNNGFTYLNSKECSGLNDKKILIENQIIAQSGPAKDELFNLYNQFHREMDARESKMIENIWEFSKFNKFEKAVFLLGYAHRESLREKLFKHEESNNNQITWAFYNE